MAVSFSRYLNAAAACSLLVLAQVGAAQSAESFDIPAQTLSKSLLELSRQSGVNIVVDPSVVAGKQAPALRGETSVDESLQRLLQGTGLTAERTSDNTVLIKRSPSAGSGDAQTRDAGDVLETVSVFARMEDQLSIGSKTGEALRDIPKSVTMVTSAQIEAQNLTTLVDALNQSTGVTLASYSPVDPFYFSRGFRMNTVQVDGGAPAYTGSFGSFWTPDMAVYDHIEVLRGVDGMFTGAGEPGGIVNLVRKRAKAAPQVALSASAGSWDNYRAELDVTGGLALDGRLRGRFVGAYEDRGYFWKGSNTEKSIAYATGEFDLTESTLLVFGGSYEKRDESGYNGGRGLPRYLDGGDLGLKRSSNFVPDWAHWNFETKQYFARVEQQYGVTGVVKLNYTRIDQTSDLRYMYPYGPIDPATGTGTIGLGYGGDYQSKQDLIDLSASGKFELFGREHSYTVGTDYARIDGSGQRDYNLDGYVYPNGPAIDVFDFNPGAYAKPGDILTALYPKNGQTQKGVYATLGFQLTEPLRLTLGARYSEFEYEQTYQPVAGDGSYGVANVDHYTDNKIIPSIALNYKLNADWSAYASYSETFKSQSNLRGVPGGYDPGAALPWPKPTSADASSPLKPVTGAGYELGIKGEVFGMLNVSAAIYRVERNGEGVTDTRFDQSMQNTGVNCCFVDTADVTSQGFDTEVSGTVLPGWQLFAGYTYNETDFEGGSAGPVYFLGLTPRHMFKAWTSYQLPGAWSRVTLSGGLNAQSKSYVNSYSFPGRRFIQSGYALANAAISYQVTDNWTVSLHGDNLFDKRYYQVLGDIYNENVYGTPANFVLSIRGRW